jgi:hypothetical protein
MAEQRSEPMRLKRMLVKPSVAEKIRAKYGNNISEAIRSASLRYSEGASVPPKPEKELADVALASFMPQGVFEKATARAKAEGRRLPEVVASMLLAED